MDEETLKELIELFKEAVNHLEWCGYGDSYERECAREQKLPERLNEMVAKLPDVDAQHKARRPII